MRMRRVTILVTTVFALALGTAGLAIAQTEAERAETPVAVDVDVTWQARLDDGHITMAGEPGAAYSKLDGRAIAERWEATDPRLSGEMTHHSTWHIYPFLDYEIASIEYALANDAGSWVGHGTRMWRGNWPIEAGAETMVMHGDGAYDGLTAYLTHSCPQDCTDAAHRMLHGLIVDEELPPFPETAE